MHPRTWSTFRKVKDSDSRYQLEPSPTSESRRFLFGVPVYLSSQISVAETVGATSTCSWLAVCDMSQIVLGRNSQVRVSYGQECYFEYDQTAIRSTSRWAIANINEEAVELLTGVTV